MKSSNHPDHIETGQAKGSDKTKPYFRSKHSKEGQPFFRPSLIQLEMDIDQADKVTNSSKFKVPLQLVDDEEIPQPRPIEAGEDLQMNQNGNPPDIQRAMPEGDPIHNPLLDQYSQATGRSRDSLTQHDPGYEQWVVPIDIVLDMAVPQGIPSPDYSYTKDELNAWEQANFIYTPRLIYNCESVTRGGEDYNYVSEAGIRLINTRFEYFIAHHIQENMNFGNNRGIWHDINRSIRTHSREHFNQYSQTVNEAKREFYNRLVTLPNRFNPIQVRQERLENYIEALLRYFVAKLHFELWQVKCDWERTDYPRVLRRVGNVGGRLTPNCGTQPPTPVPPTMITPPPSSSIRGTSGSNISTSQNQSP